MIFQIFQIFQIHNFKNLFPMLHSLSCILACMSASVAVSLPYSKNFFYPKNLFHSCPVETNNNGNSVIHNMVNHRRTKEHLHWPVVIYFDHTVHIFYMILYDIILSYHMLCDVMFYCMLKYTTGMSWSSDQVRPVMVAMRGSVSAGVCYSSDGARCGIIL